MAKIFLRKGRYNFLAAADDSSLEYIKKMKLGQAYSIEIKKERNYENHKRFFAMLNIAFDLTDGQFNTLHGFRKWLLMAAGYATPITGPDKRTYWDVDSISFSSMDEIKFQEVFNACVDIFIQHWGDKISKEKLMEISEFAGD